VFTRCLHTFVIVIACSVLLLGPATSSQVPAGAVSQYEFNDSHVHLTNYIQEGTSHPGVFCGIGEFTIHKEFVSAKLAGSIPSLLDPALDRILDLAEEAGLVVLIHNDVDVPFANPDKPPAYSMI
jgi:hypothetical protein